MVLKRAAFETTEIREGDQVEIVNFVGGGTVDQTVLRPLGAVVAFAAWCPAAADCATLAAAPRRQAPPPCELESRPRASSNPVSR